MKKGFTLIELLVVVLIIGILAAIAVPQYFKIIEKSRVAQVIPLGKAIKDAADRYYTNHSTYPLDVNMLDVSFSCPKHYICEYFGDITDIGDGGKISFKSAKGYGLVFGFEHRPNTSVAASAYCVALKTEKKAMDVCSQFGEKLWSEDIYVRYSIK